jgi:predicted MFS family arabinose efflux permease
MKRFLMLVAVAVVAGAMYVAASPASQQSRGPTAKQFKALKKQVAALSKKVNTVQNDVASVAIAYIHCSLPSEIGVSQRGNSTSGYLFGNSTASTPTTALDLASSSPTYVLTPYNASDAQCQQLIGAVLRHRPATAVFAQTFGKH